MEEEKETLENQFGEEETPETSEEEPDFEALSEEEENLQDAEALQKKIKELLAQKEHHRKKRFEAEKRLKDLEQQLANLQKGKATSGIDPVELTKTVATLKDYTPEELDFIAMVSKAKGLSLAEAAKTEEAQTYIQALREKGRRESQTPPPTTRSPQSEGKNEVSSLSDEELKKNFSQVVGEIIAKKRGKKSYE